MTNSLEEILSALISGTATENKNNNQTTITEINSANEKGLRIQRKIDILKSFEPIVSDKNKEFINFFIKALSIAKLISDMDVKD